MSTNKNIDRVCIVIMIIAILATIIFICPNNLISANTVTNLGYENRIFDTSKVHTIDIVMDNWDDFISSCENEEYSPCTAIIDGEKFANIALRAKGNTSLSNVKEMDSSRYSFKIEFDHYEEAKSYYGLDKLCLNNLIQDNTMMKDYLVYQMMNDFGVSSPLCSYVYITVNNEDWGLYLAVESIEDSFLTRNYGSDAGDLYKPDSMSFGGGKGNGKEFDMKDFDFSQEGIKPPDGFEKNNDSVAKNENDRSDSTREDEGFFPGNMQPPQGGFSGDGMNFPGGMTPPSGMDATSDTESSADMNFPDEMTPPGNMTPPEDMGTPGDMNFPGGGGPGGKDFGMGSSDVKLKYTDDNIESYSNIFDNAKTNVTTADKNRLISSLKQLNEYSDLESCLDTEEVLRYFVVHNYVVNGDSYTGSMIHNYYLYEEDGSLSMIPWDYNLAFGTFQANNASEIINQSIDNPISNDEMDDRPMLGWIFSDDEYTQRYHELFQSFATEWLTSGKLEQLIEDTSELIRPYVEKDPSKFCSIEDFEKGIVSIKQFTSLRSQAVINQLAGNDELIETDGVTLSDMGSMQNDKKGGPTSNKPFPSK